MLHSRHVPPIVLRCAFFKAASGIEPAKEWLRALRKEVRGQIGSNIAKVQRMWPVSRPLVGGLGMGLYEVRTAFDKNEYRVFFCIEGSTMIILHGFQKKTQQTPAGELRLARQRQKDEP